MPEVKSLKKKNSMLGKVAMCGYSKNAIDYFQVT